MNLKAAIKTCIDERVTVCARNDSLKSVAEKIVVNRAAACVVKDQGDVVGIITDSDVVDHIARGIDLDRAKAGELMTPGEVISKGLGPTFPFIQLSEDETIENALKVLAKGGIHHILIRGAGGKTVGIVSAVDLIRGALELYTELIIL